MKLRKFLILVFSILIGLIMWSCEKESNLPDGKFIGTWISTNTQDNLNFLSDSVFTKQFYDGLDHPFIYSYTYDSITIQYKGPLYILVLPTTHHYEFKEKELLIDFANGCYGFDKKVIKYIRK